MFRFATIATVATMATVQALDVAEIKKILGPKCTMSADSTAMLAAMEKGEAPAEQTAEQQAAQKAKRSSCKEENIDDIMCPNFDAVKALNMKINPPAKNDEEQTKALMKEKAEQTAKIMKCNMQCMACENFPDSLSGANTLVAGVAMIATAAALF